MVLHKTSNLCPLARTSRDPSSDLHLLRTLWIRRYNALPVVAKINHATDHNHAAYGGEQDNHTPAMPVGASTSAVMAAGQDVIVTSMGNFEIQALGSQQVARLAEAVVYVATAACLDAVGSPSQPLLNSFATTTSHVEHHAGPVSPPDLPWLCIDYGSTAVEKSACSADSRLTLNVSYSNTYARIA